MCARNPRYDSTGRAHYRPVRLMKGSSAQSVIFELGVLYGDIRALADISSAQFATPECVIAELKGRSFVVRVTNCPQTKPRRVLQGDVTDCAHPRRMCVSGCALY